MKTKLFVEILQHGSHNESICKMIAGHNSGKRELELDDIKAYINCKAAEYPTLYSNCWANHQDEKEQFQEHMLFVTEDSGKTFTLFIEERVIHELQPQTETTENIEQ